MANIGTLLKQEIARVARKEIRAAADPLRKTGAAHRREIAALKREIAELQRTVRTLSRGTAKAAPAAEEAGERSARFSVKALKTMRARTGLSATDFGRLAGVSGQSIYGWEAGKTTPGPKQRAALAGLRGLGKREALRRLEALA